MVRLTPRRIVEANLTQRGQKSPAEAATAGCGATAQACLAAGTPCYKVYKVYKDKAFSQELRLLACS